MSDNLSNDLVSGALASRIRGECGKALMDMHHLDRATGRVDDPAQLDAVVSESGAIIGVTEAADDGLPGTLADIFYAAEIASEDDAAAADGTEDGTAAEVTEDDTAAEVTEDDAAVDEGTEDDAAVEITEDATEPTAASLARADDDGLVSQTTDDDVTDVDDLSHAGDVTEVMYFGGEFDEETEDHDV